MRFREKISFFSYFEKSNFIQHTQLRVRILQNLNEQPTSIVRSRSRPRLLHSSPIYEARNLLSPATAASFLSFNIRLHSKNYLRFE